MSSGCNGNRQVLVLFVIMTSAAQVLCLGTFQLVLRRFRNDCGLAADSSCCSGTTSRPSSAETVCDPSTSRGLMCSQPCRTFFRICLSHYLASIPSHPACTYGLVTTSVLGQNSFSPTGSNLAGHLESFQFDFSWTGSFSLIVEAFHALTSDSPAEGSARKLIYRLAIQRLLPVAENWTQEANTDRNTSVSLVYEYRVTCQATYYGTDCSRYCVSHDDLSGHYDCDDEGQRICRPGWTGSYCNTAICKEGCNATNGDCNYAPLQCRCRPGWQGQYCNECTRHPDCIHGTCFQPWQCICDSGWGGSNCDIDLNFCARQNPCQNGGTCSSNLTSNYTCLCLPGFHGQWCETIRPNSCRRDPCINGGTCKTINGSDVCACPRGYFGQRCHLQIVPEVTLPEVTPSEANSTVTLSTVATFTGVTSLTTNFSNRTVGLTWTEISLIVCLGVLLPVLLASASGVLCVLLRRRRRKRSKDDGAQPSSTCCDPARSAAPDLHPPKPNSGTFARSHPSLPSDPHRFAPASQPGFVQSYSTSTDPNRTGLTKVRLNNLEDGAMFSIPVSEGQGRFDRSVVPERLAASRPRLDPQPKILNTNRTKSHRCEYSNDTTDDGRNWVGSMREGQGRVEYDLIWVIGRKRLNEEFVQSTDV